MLQKDSFLFVHAYGSFLFNIMFGFFKIKCFIQEKQCLRMFCFDELIKSHKLLSVVNSRTINITGQITQHPES